MKGINYRHETPDPHRLMVNISDKINLKKRDKAIALSNHSVYYIRKNIKKSYRKN